MRTKKNIQISIICSLFIILFIYIGCGSGSGVDKIYYPVTSELAGEVFFEGQNLQDVKVSAQKKTVKINTNTFNTGEFKFVDIISGENTVEIKKEGYYIKEQKVDIVPGKSNKIEVELEKISENAKLLSIESNLNEIELEKDIEVSMDIFEFTGIFEDGRKGIISKNDLQKSFNGGEISSENILPKENEGFYNLKFYKDSAECNIRVKIEEVAEIEKANIDATINVYSEGAFKLDVSKYAKAETDNFIVLTDEKNKISGSLEDDYILSGFNNGSTKTISILSLEESGKTRFQDKFSLTEGVGDKPSNITGLTIIDTQETSVSLDWNKSFNSKEYVITLYKDLIKEEEFTQSSTEITIQNISVGEDYIIEIYAENDFGKSLESSINLMLIGNTKFTLTVNSGANGSASDQTGEDSYYPGSDINILAIPDTGYRFLNWSGDTDYVGDINLANTTIRMPASNVNIQANFEVDTAQTYILTVNSGANGSASDDTGTGPYNVEATVNISATPDAGYKFVNWTGDTTNIGDVNSVNTTITMPVSNTTIQANFEVDTAQTYTLTVNSGANGSASDDTGAGPYSVEETVNISATPDAGYRFVNWTGDTTNIVDVNSANTTIIMEATNTTVQANFETIPGTFWTEATANTGFTGRWGQTSIVYENKIWIIGGNDGAALKKDVWYSEDGINWTQATANANFSGRNGPKGLVYDNKMWIIGGYDGSAKNDVWYSEDGINWTQATASAAFSARYYFSALVYDNKMWVIGGTDGSDRNDVWYSEDGATWTQATANAGFSAREFFTALVYDNKMWVIGGWAGAAANDVWYSEDGVNWTQATASANFSGRWGPEGTVHDNKMFVIGGNDGSNKNDVWYSEDGINWTEATDNSGFSARYGHSCLSFDDKVWVISGGNKNDAWYSE
ncbi:MAG: hypothetical protein C0601_08085 [Candidatus Muiribacterium halophilum]|uniref:Fibronectin type-III domain-containing protein n=1 Tax=Muiribacterium halophilum TaxID=2053465 RepID=A0A2N5ZF32_MUIH1|nr:MAG: hypothetical protein C0601_08085 [Candidatus Muirbacterium halophilum]